MKSNLIKVAALNAIARGVKVPERYLDRYLELTHLKQLLALDDINVVLDVGANEGQFARELREIGYRGYIVSFEPVAGVFERLSKNFSGDPRWRGCNFALGSENRTSLINVHELSVMSSFLESIAERKGADTELVEIRRLDAILDGVVDEVSQPRIFLKMDTQGFDLEVFAGARECLPSIVGIQSELSVQPLYVGMPSYIEALTTYADAGFSLFNVSVVNRISSGGLLELNAFMRRG